MDKIKEIRSLNAELRLAEDQPDKPKTIVGYAAKYNQSSCDLGGFTETIRTGAFTQTLKDNDEVVCLFNHDNNLLLGRNSSGTLKLSEDETGLAIDLLPPDTTLGNDIRELIARGDLSKMSFGFYVEEDSWQEQPDGKMIRELIKVRLCDVSIVTNPAYESTEVSLRSLEQYKANKQPIRRGNQYYAQILLNAG